MLKYEKIDRVIWASLKKAIEKDFDIKLEKKDSGKFPVLKYFNVTYEYDSSIKSLIIKLPWIVPKKTMSKVDGWIKKEIDSAKAKDKKSKKKRS